MSKSIVAPPFSPGASRYLVVGANHQSSPLSLRDRLFVEDAELPAFFAVLKESGVEQAMALSTCDRVEVWAAGADIDGIAERIVAALARHAGMTETELAGQLYRRADDEAVRHAVTVAAALDSQIVGEPQILGQVKAAHRLARDAGMTGGEIEALLQAAYGAAKRVRSETAIGERPVSMAAAAVQIAREVLGDLGHCRALLIGAGDMGVMIAGELRSGGLGDLTVIHPRDSRAEAVARELDSHVAAIEEMAETVAGCDVVISALGTRRRSLTTDFVQAALLRRRRRPIFIVDAGIPGDVDPGVNRLDGAFLYDMDDLERVAMEGRASRVAEADVARTIVAEEVAAFLRSRAERAAVPVLSRLRTYFEDTRGQVLAVAGSDADKATRLLINRLLHGPSEALRDLAARDAGEAADGLSWDVAEAMLRRLFRLDEDAAGDVAKEPPERGTGERE
jgi:glutamyl-tRNA reductase